MMSSCLTSSPTSVNQHNSVSHKLKKWWSLQWVRYDNYTEHILWFQSTPCCHSEPFVAYTVRVFASTEAGRGRAAEYLVFTQHGGKLDILFITTNSDRDSERGERKRERERDLERGGPEGERGRERGREGERGSINLWSCSAGCSNSDWCGETQRTNSENSVGSLISGRS